jgi:hypothetical protein
LLALSNEKKLQINLNQLFPSESLFN